MTAKNLTIKPAKREKAASSKNHYVPNADLLEAFHEAKAAGYLTDRLAGYLMKIAHNYARHPWFNRYSYVDDMVATAAANLCANWHKFNPEVSDSPFSYYTTACYRSFLSVKDAEYKQRDIKDAMLIDGGANPSFGYSPRNVDGDSTE